jgi:hypothetical protein
VANRWKIPNNDDITANGLKITNGTNEWRSVCAEKEFAHSVDFPDSIVCYFEVTKIAASSTWFQW